MNQDIRFPVPFTYRIRMAVVFFISVFIMSNLAVSFLPHADRGILYSIPFACTLVLYFIAPAYIVKEDRLVFNYMLVKQGFPYAQGVFHVQKRLGLASLVNTFLSSSYALRLEGEKRPLTLILLEADALALMKAMRERGARLEGLSEAAPEAATIELPATDGAKAAPAGAVTNGNQEHRAGAQTENDGKPDGHSDA